MPALPSPWFCRALARASCPLPSWRRPGGWRCGVPVRASGLAVPCRTVGAVALVLALASCASPLPALTWLRLPLLPAAGEAAPPAAASSEVWQLMAPVGLPGHLDRDALLVPQGAAGLQALGGARWAEPLRDAVPRLLQHDLARAWSAPVWAAPLPPGVRPTRQLRVQLGALDVAADGRSVHLQARWSVADPLGTTPPRLGQAAFSVAATGSDAEALAAAHRQALWQLALRIAAAP